MSMITQDMPRLESSAAQKMAPHIVLQCHIPGPFVKPDNVYVKPPVPHHSVHLRYDHFMATLVGGGGDGLGWWGDVSGILYCIGVLYHTCPSTPPKFGVSQWGHPINCLSLARRAKQGSYSVS